jgi:hypothetical protein
MRSWKTELVRTWRRFCSAQHFIRFLFLGELEAMLKDQTPPAPSKASQPSLSPTSAESHSPSSSTYPGLTNTTITTLSSTFHAPNHGLEQGYQPSSVTFNGVPPPSKNFLSLVDTHPEAVKAPSTAAFVSEIQGDTSSFLSNGFGYDVIWPAWPRDLPSPSLVRHL